MKGVMRLRGGRRKRGGRKGHLQPLKEELSLLGAGSGGERRARGTGRAEAPTGHDGEGDDKNTQTRKPGEKIRGLKCLHLHYKVKNKMCFKEVIKSTKYYKQN